MHRGVFVGENQLRVRLGYGNHVETISISTEFFGQIHRETFPTRKSIAIINHLHFFRKGHLDLSLFITFVLWSDLESSRMYRWNKISVPPFGARSIVYHPCNKLR